MKQMTSADAEYAVIACLINRAPSTISRELRRNREVCGRYSARVAQQRLSF